MAATLAQLARTQRGVVTVAQLRQLGMSPRELHTSVKRGRLIRTDRGVYAVGHVPDDHGTAEQAALLAAGDHSALGFASAISRHGIIDLWDYEGEVHVVVPRGRSTRGASSAIVRRVTYLDPRNVVEVDGLRCTDVSLTLIHLARRLRETKLRLVCERAEYERKLDVEALAATLARMPPPPGVRALRKVLADTSLETALLDSSLERRMIRLLRGAGVDAGVPQHWFVLPTIGRVRADLWFEDSMLVVEVDGPHHRLPMQRAKDRRRDAALAAVGIRTVRVSDELLDDAPELALEAVTRWLK